MWLTITIILLAIAMMVGPVMMMQPTTRQRRTAKIRAYANKLGMQIRLPKGKSKSGAEYYMPPSQELGKIIKRSSWHLEKQNSSHEIHFHDRWDWAGQGRPSTELQAKLISYIDDLPEGISALIVDSLGCGCLWDERIYELDEEGAVDALRLRLQSLQNLVLENA